MGILLDHYRQSADRHELQDDPAQCQAIMALDLLLDRLRKPSRKRFFFSRSPAAVKGVYLHGPVGRGKTMLMDWFFHAARKSGLSIERWHFHAFMLEIHRALHDARQTDKTNRITHLADRWAKRLSILCFDEFHVTDVADAMIMMPLFDRLFSRGVTLVATSNWPPEALYKNGLQRARFLPFIDILKKHMAVVAMAGEYDYRLVNRAHAAAWLFPLDAGTKKIFEDAFTHASGYDPVEPKTITIGKGDKARQWVIPRAGKCVALLDMAEILSRPSGAADFLALAAEYSFLFLDNLTPFRTDEKDKAKRFMVMIDALYDKGVSLVVRAAAQPEALYPPDGALAFEFSRTLSRLREMTAPRQPQQSAD